MVLEPVTMGGFASSSLAKIDLMIGERQKIVVELAVVAVVEALVALLEVPIGVPAPAK